MDRPFAPVRRCRCRMQSLARNAMGSYEWSVALDGSRHIHGTNAAEHGHGTMPIASRSRHQNAVVCRRYTGVVAACRGDCTSSTSWGIVVRLASSAPGGCTQDLSFGGVARPL
jgi:hypothetical protein